MAFDPEDLDQPAPTGGLFAGPGRGARRPAPATARETAAKPKGKDTDGDGVTDLRERALGSSTTNRDTDGDGLRDDVELRLGTHVRVADTDGDGTDDGLEVAAGVTSPRVREPDAQRDVRSRIGDHREATEIEQQLGLRRNVDTDRDGFADWVEEIRATDRLTADLTPDQIENNLSNLGRFMEAAEAQVGKRYEVGARGDVADPDGPDALGAPELVQWAGRQAGLRTMPGEALQQYRHLAGEGGAVSMEQALATKGALVFGFSSDPAAGAPARTFVAISLGNGKVLDVAPDGTFQAIDPGRVYSHGAVIPRLHQPKGDMDGDGNPDLDELLMNGDPSRGGSMSAAGDQDLDRDGIPYDMDPDERAAEAAGRLTSALDATADPVDPVDPAGLGDAAPALAAAPDAPTTSYPERGYDDTYDAPAPDPASLPDPSPADSYAATDADPGPVDAYDTPEPAYPADDAYTDDTSYA